MNRIDELNKKLKSPLYKELDKINKIEEIEKYEKTDNLRNFKSINEQINNIVENQTKQLNQISKYKVENELENTIEKMNYEVDEMLEKIEKNNQTIYFEKEKFNMTSSSLNIDEEILKKMDKKINFINSSEKEIDELEEKKIDLTNNDEKSKIIITDDTYNFTIKDLEVETKYQLENKKGNKIVIFVIIIMLIIIIGLVYFLFI